VVAPDGTIVAGPESTPAAPSDGTGTSA